MLETKDMEQAKQRLVAARAFLHLDEKAQRLQVLEDQIAQPSFWDDVNAARDVSREADACRETLASYERVASQLDDVQVALEMAADDESMYVEAESLYQAFCASMDALEMESWFAGKYDTGDAILSVNPGAGGLEAQDWTEMLYRMYRRFAERHNWRVTLLDVVPGEGIGLDKAVIQIEGKNAYGMLKGETGVHRLVRISPTDKDKRRHTTFAAVQVMPVLKDDIEVNLDVADVRVDVYRASGNGGQCVNTTDSAVRLTHIPTGIVVTCQNEKSQLQNKEAAFKVLRGRLFEIEEQKRAAEINSLRGDVRNIEFGSQIRNYVLYPYQLVKDVRSNVETSNVDAVLDGDIDDFIFGYHKWFAAQ